MMVAAVDWLSEILAQTTPFDAPVLGARRDILDAAKRAGWVKPAGTPDTMRCRECLQIADVVGSRNRPALRCECGVRPLSSADVSLFRADHSALMDAICELGAVKGRISEKLSERLWCLGDCTLEGARFPMWFARLERNAAVHASIASALNRSSPGEAGVIVSAGSSAADFTWPRGSRAAPLSELILFEGDHVSLHARALYEHAPSEAFARRAGGRPGGLGNALDLFNRRVKSKTALPALADEVRAIRAILYDRYGSRALPTSSIKKAINAAHEAHFPVTSTTQRSAR